MWLCEEVICGHVLSCSLSIDLEIEFLGRMVTLIQNSDDCQTAFQSGCSILHDQLQCVEIQAMHPKETESKVQRSVLEGLEQMA